MNTEIARPKSPVRRKTLWLNLSRRYAVRTHLHRPIAWLGYTLASINIVAIALLVFDAPLGAAAKSLSPQLIWFASRITNVGLLVSVLAVICALAIIGLLLARRLPVARRRFRVAALVRVTAYLATSVLSASLAVHILKYAIGRARPPLFDAVGIFHFEPFDGGFMLESFPSAHATHIGALFAALALLFPRFRLLFAGLGLWLGVTRIIVGVHYPSDVAAGLALGIWFAFATAVIFSRFGLVFSPTPNGLPTPRRTLTNP